MSRTEYKGVTRGHGLLETYLAKKRGDIADRLIPASIRDGRLLDIGCGVYPLFLVNIGFKEKIGLDKISRNDRTPMACPENVKVIDFDLESGQELPFVADFFDAVTMLAVVEHIDPGKLVDIVKNIYRVLKPGGHFVMTTPASWTDGLLRVMARAGLVSREEIEEHRDVYSPRKIMDILRNGNFRTGVVRYGYFEMFANIWVAASK